MLQSLFIGAISATTFVWVIVLFLVNAPVLLGGWYYFSFFRNKSSENKKRLPRAHLMNIIAIVCQFAAFTVLGLIINKGNVYAMGYMGQSSTMT